MPLVPVLAAHGAQRRADRCRRAAPRRASELGKRMLELQQQAYALAGRARSTSIRRKQLQARSCSTNSSLPARLKTADRPAVDQRGSAGGDRRRPRAAAADPRIPRPGQAALAPTPTSCRAWSTRAPAACTPATTRRRRRPDACRRPIRTCRTSRSAPRKAGASARRSSRRRAGAWSAADYSQIELRIMAHLSGDAALLRGVRAKARTSIARPRRKCSACRRTRSAANQRRAAKAINFGLMYGMSAFGLARQLGIGRGEAQRLHRALFRALPGRARVHGRARASRRSATATSKPCSAAACIWRTSIRATRPAPRGAERAAINAPMQGTRGRHHQARDDRGRRAGCSDRDDAHMLMQVHDELVFEVREDAVDEVRAAVIERMAGAAELRCRCWSMSASARTGTRRTETRAVKPSSSTSTAAYVSPLRQMNRY